MSDNIYTKLQELREITRELRDKLLYLKIALDDLSSESDKEEYAETIEAILSEIDSWRSYIKEFQREAIRLRKTSQDLRNVSPETLQKWSEDLTKTISSANAYMNSLKTLSTTIQSIPGTKKYIDSVTRAYTWFNQFVNAQTNTKTQVDKLIKKQEEKPTKTTETTEQEPEDIDEQEKDFGSSESVGGKGSVPNATDFQKIDNFIKSSDSAVLQFVQSVRKQYPNVAPESSQGYFTEVLKNLYMKGKNYYPSAQKIYDIISKEPYRSSFYSPDQDKWMNQIKQQSTQETTQKEKSPQAKGGKMLHKKSLISWQSDEQQNNTPSKRTPSRDLKDDGMFRREADTCPNVDEMALKIQNSWTALEAVDETTRICGVRGPGWWTNVLWEFVRRGHGREASYLLTVLKSSEYKSKYYEPQQEKVVQTKAMKDYKFLEMKKKLAQSLDNGALLQDDPVEPKWTAFKVQDKEYSIEQLGIRGFYLKAQSAEEALDLFTDVAFDEEPSIEELESLFVE